MVKSDNDTRRLVQVFGGMDPCVWSEHFDNLTLREWESRGICSGNALHKAANDADTHISKGTCVEAYKAPHDMTVRTAEKLSPLFDYRRMARKARAEMLSASDTTALVEHARTYEDVKGQISEAVSLLLRMGPDELSTTIKALRGIATEVRPAPADYDNARAILALQVLPLIDKLGRYDYLDSPDDDPETAASAMEY